jgi:biopolymer transport protein TolQ
VSWTIIVYKWRELRRAGQDSEAFLEIYQEGSLESAYSRARELHRSPLAGIFATAYAELSRMLKFAGRGSLEEKHLQALARHIGWAGSREGLRLERGLNFLATTGSAAPFIGLFGTVWGIMSSFQEIASAGSTSLNVVAPGIAEALVATAAGLFAAIPAVYFYNDLTSHVKAFSNEMEDFSMEFLTIAERNFT